MSRFFPHPSQQAVPAVRLYGRRIVLRPLTPGDWDDWAAQGAAGWEGAVALLAAALVSEGGKR